MLKTAHSDPSNVDIAVEEPSVATDSFSIHPTLFKVAAPVPTSRVIKNGILSSGPSPSAMPTSGIPSVSISKVGVTSTPSIRVIPSAAPTHGHVAFVGPVPAASSGGFPSFPLVHSQCEPTRKVYTNHLSSC